MLEIKQVMIFGALHVLRHEQWPMHVATKRLLHC